LATQNGLRRLGRPAWRVSRWLNAISMASWGKSFRVTVPGTLSQLTMIGLVAGVLAAGLPPNGQAGWTLATWTAGVVYGMLVIRSFTNEVTIGTSAASERWYGWAHRLAGVGAAASYVAALAVAHFGRGLGQPSALPGLLLASLLPLLLGLETTRVDRAMHAADLEHAEQLAAAQARLARLAGEAAGRLGSVAVSELIQLSHDAVRPLPDPHVAGAVAALRDAPDLLAALPKLSAAGTVEPARAAELLQAALAGWPGAGSTSASGRALSLWEAELCMRVTRLLVMWLADREPAPTDRLTVCLEARPAEPANGAAAATGRPPQSGPAPGAVAKAEPRRPAAAPGAVRLVYELEARLSAVKFNALVSRLTAAVGPTGGEVAISPVGAAAIAINWPAGGEVARG
jgi:hypothetical protein